MDVQLNYGEAIIGGYIEIFNPSNHSIENITIEIDDYLKNIVDLKISNLEIINPNETVKIYLDLNKENSAMSGYYDGQISLQGGSFEDYLYVGIEVLEEIEEEFDEQEEFNHTIIEEPDFEDQNKSEILEEDLGEDNEEKIKLGIWVWAVLFIVFIVLILYFVYNKKKKKTNSPFSEN